MPIPTQPQTPADDDAYYRAVLNGLVDQGARLARNIHDRATAATPTPENRPEADPTVAFDRAARAVRRCIALARHIAAGPALQRPAQPTRAHARAQLIRGVEDAIHRKRRETDAEILYAELAERLEDPELELDLQGRAVDDVIEEICRDLGVAVQGRSYIWKRRTPQDIATLRERAARSPGQAAAFHLIQGGKPHGANNQGANNQGANHPGAKIHDAKPGPDIPPPA